MHWSFIRCTGLSGDFAVSITTLTKKQEQSCPTDYDSPDIFVLFCAADQYTDRNVDFSEDLRLYAATT